MASSSERVQEIVSKFADIHILVFGDLILDKYIWGQVNRISPEAPVVVVDVTEENKRPGGAGNVVHNLIALGAKVSVCGVVGDDESGRNACQLLVDMGANIDGIVVDPSRPTSVKTRIIAQHQHVVRVDKETKTPVSASVAEELNVRLRQQLEKVNGLIISDYAKGSVSASLFDTIKIAHNKGIFGLHTRPLLIDPKDPNFDLYRHASVVKPNRREAQQATGMKIKSRADAIEVARALVKKWGCEAVLITLGEDGMVFVAQDEAANPTTEIDTEAQEIFDVSGAGDTVAAVMTLSLAAGASVYEAAKLATYGAGVVVGEIGVVPIYADKLTSVATKGGL